MKKPKKLTPEQEMIVAFMLATQGAFQALQEVLINEGINPGIFPAALDAIASLYEDKGRDLPAKMILEIRSSLTDAPRQKRAEANN
ncbi:hypothetical protein SAMN05444159_1284 [Bradyrhizobium lablabi]|uniref:Uncharacterized protein n=1 Tax=Bradyrhizobium lablabi TaxID=722472 RepID=A0A1M6LIA0_9BRAD|nr:hypothetical protein [Bradyrhizobium lablabi]SHJ70907.1 hypothetical protein SAMN05444159_1284 [Bradyrhizobium lablabi]